MRKIEFLAPVEAMRGNMSGKQKLVYPTKDNSAWDAPSGVRSYATNYNTRYIGSKRSGDGLKFFSVKQRSAVKMTPAMRLNQALLGGSRSCAVAALNNLQFRTALTQWILYYKQNGSSVQQPEFIPTDFKQNWSSEGVMLTYLTRCFRQMLERKVNAYTFQTQGDTFTFSNPWNPSTSSSNIQLAVPQDLVVKFWSELADGGYTFSVTGDKGIANSTSTWATIINDDNMNILDLTSVNISGTEYVQRFGRYLYTLDPSTGGRLYEESSEAPAPVNYLLTSVAPEP